MKRTFSQWIGFLIIISLCPKRRVDGVRVLFTDLKVDRAESAARIHRAMEAMSAAGKHYETLLKRIRYIVVWPGDHAFADGVNGVHIPSADLVELDEFALAAVFVHEAVHLRISARGIKYKPECREQIERLCITEQARFLRCVPCGYGEQMARDAEELLASPWWTPEQREADLERLLNEHHLPKWLKTVMPRR
jgi:hypothetical protein